MEYKRWYCSQVVEKERNGDTISLDVISRNVGAKTKEEAIGKFVIETSNFKATHRFNLECFELDNLAKID